MNEKLNNILGALQGEHAGDALGAGVEFYSRDFLRKNYPNMVRDITGGGTFNWDPGAPTDDTDLTIAVARAYVEHPAGGSDLIHAAGEHFLAWYQNGPVDIGNATAKALSTLANTGNPFKSGCADTFSASNGSLMRTVPVGLARRVSDPRLIVEARQISEITHALPVCVESCVAYCVMISALVEGMDATQAIKLAKDYTQNQEVLDAIGVAETCDLIEDLPTPHGGYVLHSFRVAVWALTHDVSFESGVMAAVYLGEDTDTNGAIAGGLLGAREGVNEIPTRWLEKLECKSEMNKLGLALLDIRQNH